MPPMGKETVHFKCHHCSHCCKDVVCLPTPWDVIRIVRETGLDPYRFLEFIGPEEVSEVAKSDPTWLFCDGQRYLMALRRDKQGCFFLDKKTFFCKAYDHRPILCRLYPLALHETRSGEFKSFTLHKDVGCPRNRDGIVQTPPFYALYLEDCGHQDDYADLVGIFNRDQTPNKKPRDFIKLFITGADILVGRD